MYAKSYALTEIPTVQSVSNFQNRHGYRPQVIAFNNAVYGVAATKAKAQLALELAQDGAMVEQLAEAFGGIEYMTEEARPFIETGTLFLPG